MQKIFWISFFMLTTITSYGDISQIPIYPSGINVSFTAPHVEEKEEIEEKPAPKRFSLRRKKKGEEKPEPVEPPALMKVNRLIRVINGIKNSDENHQVALVFYDEEKKILKNNTIVIKKSAKPAANYIFFMDRSTGNSFKGMKDIYHLPKKAEFFQVALVDKKENILIMPSHPGYNKEGTISIEDYKNIMPKNKIMLQFELTGTAEKPHVKIAAFRFY
ncbi:hypothetical protein [Brevinema andersonii]|nr:hypothetical protein [Brevinema andersonii]